MTEPPFPPARDLAPTDAAAPQSQLEEAIALVGQVRAEMAKVIVGLDDIVVETLAALLAGGHVLLEGVPGVGKTLLALSLAKSFGGEFRRVQFTPDLMPTDITGHSVYRPETGEFRIRKGPTFTHVLLADEINRAPAKTQAALLEVMQEQQVSIEGQSFALPGPFFVMATQNPIEHEGTYPLPEAQLDRFLLKVVIDYPPTGDDEVAIVERVTAGQMADKLDVEEVRAVLSPGAVVGLQRAAANVLVDRRIVDYAVRVVRKSRSWPGLSFGAGPRAGIALVRCARAYALLDGRSFVVPDDIKRAVLPVLRHRVAVSPEQEMSGESSDAVLTVMLREVEAPRQ